MKADDGNLVCNRTSLVNFLVGELGYSSYLEIGLGKGKNYRKIKCRRKVSVDPDRSTSPVFCLTSDEFFRHDENTYDLIFIDGLHHDEQVTRDILNALTHLNPGGTIVLHDCNPSIQEMQIVPRMQKLWTGDVWKSFVVFRTKHTPDAYVVDIDYGCGVIEAETVYQHKIRSFDGDLSWESLVVNRTDWLNIVTPSQFVARVLERGHNRRRRFLEQKV